MAGILPDRDLCLDWGDLTMHIHVFHMNPDISMSRRFCRLAVPLTALLCACSSPETAQNRRDTMTQRQKDSVLAQSQLPGAEGVAKALRAADSAKARQARLDSASRP
jgi:hypothetical protein